MKSQLFASVVITLCFLSHSFAQDGLLDPSFGNQGVLTTDIDSLNDVANDLVIQPNGKIIAAGYTSNGMIDFFCLVRYNIDGTLDPSFGDMGKVVTTFPSTSVGTSVALQADGKILLAGQTWTGKENTFAMARYLEDGRLDMNFGEQGKVVTIFPGKHSVGHAIAVQDDGKILVGGHTFVYENDYDDFALARYHANGDLDDSFGNGGLIVYDFGANAMDWLNDLKIQADGKIIAAGFSGNTFTLVRYLINGTLDATFGEGGVVHTAFEDGTFANLNSIAIQADDKIVAAGFALDSFSNFALTRYLISGELDTDFGDEGKVVTHLSMENDGINSIQIQADGKIVAGGTLNENLIRKFALARYQSNGDLDPTFGNNGVQTSRIHPTNNILNALAIHDETIVAAGLSGDFPYDFTLARYIAGTVATDHIKDFPGRLSIFPNPAQNFVHIEYELEKATPVSMQLINEQGQLLQNIVNKHPANQGLNRQTIKLSNYPAAMYWVLIELEGQRFAVEVVKPKQ